MRLRLLLASLLLTGCGSSAGPTPDGGATCTPPAGQHDVVDPATARELRAPASLAADRGIFDPSLLPTSDGALWMSYSVVPSQDRIFTVTTRSDDGGATWSAPATANAPLDFTWSDAAYCNGKPPCAARLIHEVSSLVEDAGDDAVRRFKLFTHAYVIRPGTTETHYDRGAIEIAAAPAPDGPWTVVNRLSWTASNLPAEITSGAPSFDLSGLAGLEDCALFTEPGARVKGDAIDLALGCGSASGIRIVRLRSLDHAATFAFAGTIVSESDATAIGSAAPQINAADLFTACGKDYVIASPTGVVATLNGNDVFGYDGCVVMELDESGAVVRDAGKPRVARTLTAPGGTFTGACTYREEAPELGYLVPEAVIAPPAVQFHVYVSGFGP